MKFLALLELSEGTDLSVLGPLLVPEELALWRSYRKGALREMYFQRSPLVVTLVFEGASADAVHEELASFPLIAEGLLNARIVALGPWLPLEKLFDTALTAGAFNA
ncbi:hypothetical protein [Burkholderia plantarii]|uniref:hypothetical protein n=1 Tax=Burkholderia plantarii TaxID=41899 RepID=UPI0018DCFEE2|nr:hypothetical protein [Burkholderia plantarii]MBI0329551.1 hypothetical protein [Burkholderia plantarii]